MVSGMAISKSLLEHPKHPKYLRVVTHPDVPLKKVEINLKYL